MKFSKSFLLNSIVLLLLLQYGCANSQDKTYWMITNIKKVNGDPMRGFTLSYMEDLVPKTNFVTKEGKVLHFDFPNDQYVSIDTMKSITYTRISDSSLDDKAHGKLMDSVYDVSASSSKLEIKFNYIGTGDDDKRFVIIYEKVTEKEYTDELNKTKEKARKEKAVLDAFIKDYKMDPSWKTATHAPLRDESLTSDLGEIVMRLPGNYMIDLSGNIFKEKVDQLSVGSFAKEGENYKLYMQDEPENFADAHFALVRDTKDKFDMKRYLASKSFTVLDQDANSFHAIEVAYDYEKKAAYISQYISFKHLYKDGLHLIYISKDDEGDAKDIKDLAKRHYVVMKNLSVK